MLCKSYPSFKEVIKRENIINSGSVRKWNIVSAFIVLKNSLIRDFLPEWFIINRYKFYATHLIKEYFSHWKK